MQTCETAEIAAKLTEAQKAALLQMPAGGEYVDEWSTPPWPNLHMRAALGSLGEMRPNTRFNHAFRLTALGRIVRDYIQEPSA